MTNRGSLTFFMHQKHQETLQNSLTLVVQYVISKKHEKIANLSEIKIHSKKYPEPLQLWQDHQVCQKEQDVRIYHVKFESCVPTGSLAEISSK